MPTGPTRSSSSSLLTGVIYSLGRLGQLSLKHWVQQAKCALRGCVLTGSCICPALLRWRETIIFVCHNRGPRYLPSIAVDC